MMLPGRMMATGSLITGAGAVTIGDGAAMFRHACSMELEGIVSKRIGSRYVSGKTRAWLKSKNPHFRRI
jgi:ATP-dependent DNA ligase